MVRIRSVSETFGAEIVRAVAATSADLAAFARREHAKIMRAEPRPSSFRRVVDGKVGASEDVVKPFGVIEYHYQRLAEVVQFAMETLFALSPVLSGEYRQSHTIFVNGAAVRDLSAWEPSDGEVVILNPLPYARKIELGKQKMRLPGTEKVYQQAEQIVQRRFGNVASIRYTMRPIAGAAVRGSRRERAEAAANSRRPALVIRPY